ncbi:peptidyl-tRNA hydrolase [Sulfurimonas hongkongensis]|uniref:Peptidyl-tRNA hydrolase n=1 Tax=Sulfurimonas hongkongensis TaxID=1172190 RepID=T0KSJ5_9BACT|nr:aminoacyl-tRNA hydrolase [Sulfurimonas hongkongensis]EQB39974.1 peptidyl-tRNA hydrolase [Sulfurimonas hongkongensis]
MLIVGLGNPGPSYSKNRHNIGFMVIDELVRRNSAQKLSSSSFNGELFKFSNHFLLKPLTYMNLSGNSIQAVKNFYKIDEVVVIHDDLDLPFGAVRFKRGGGHGGHNGLKSTDEKITRDYVRVRLGIGKPEHKGEVSSYVLSDFNDEESRHLSGWIAHACEAIEHLEASSLEDVSSKFSVKQF